MYIDEQLVRILRNNFEIAIKEKDYYTLNSYLNGIDDFLNSKCDSKLISDVYDFLIENKDNIEVVQYGNAVFSNLSEIRDIAGDLVLDFKDSTLLIPKPCVISKFKFDNIYSIYYNNEIICKILLKKQV